MSSLTWVNVSASIAAPALFRSSTLDHFWSPGCGWPGPPGPPPPTRGPWPSPWGVCLPPGTFWPPAPFRVLLRTLPLEHTEIVRFCVWRSNSFMSVWKLQKLEKSWTWTLSWALRHKWLIRGCLLEAQAWRVSVSHSDCYFQTVTANNKSATLEVNQWEWRQSSVIPTYLLIVIVKLLPDLTMVSWASWNVRVSINVTSSWGVSSPCVCRFGHPLHWQPTRGPRQPGQQSRRWRWCWPKKKTIYRTSIH